MTTKILLISASAGNGHTRAAQAIENYAQAQYSDTVEIKHIDLYDYTNPLVRWTCTTWYLFMVTYARWLWKIIYSLSDCKTDSIFAKIQHRNEAIMFSKVFDFIKEYNPDHIVCTHFTAPAIFSQKPEKIKAKIWIQVTDFHLHLQWYNENAAGYFVGNECVAQSLVKNGIDCDKIVVNGIPIMPKFAKEYSREECAKEVGVDTSKPVYLFMCGGSATKKMVRTVKKMLQEFKDCQIIAIAGRNEYVYKELCKLRDLTPQGQLIPLSFVDNIEKIMSCSDLLISKAGGLSVSEAMALGLPMIVYDPIPGHEEANADLLQNSGAALRADTEDVLIDKLRTLTNHPEKITMMGQAIKKMAHPFAAQTVIDKIMK